MEFKLNVYKGKDIEKTYTCHDFELRTGLCEDLMDIVDFETMVKANQGNISDAEAMAMIPMMLKIQKHHKPIMKQVFPQLTDDEYERTKTKEINTIVWQIVGYAFQELMMVAEKN